MDLVSKVRGLWNSAKNTLTKERHLPSVPSRLLAYGVAGLILLGTAAKARADSLPDPSMSISNSIAFSDYSAGNPGLEMQISYTVYNTSTNPASANNLIQVKIPGGTNDTVYTSTKPSGWTVTYYDTNTVFDVGTGSPILPGGSALFRIRSFSTNQIQKLASATASGPPLGLQFNQVLVDVPTTNLPAVLRTLQILSSHGSPSPAVGIYTNADLAILTNSVNDLITSGGTQYVNNGWTMLGNSPSQGSSNSFAMSHTNDAVLTWLWLTNHLLTANSGSGGSISGATNGWYARGFSTQIVANPLYGWSFNGWTGTLTSVQNPLDITFDQAHSLGASFIRNSYPVTFSNSIGGIFVPNGFTNAEFETEIPCEATANTGYNLSYILIDSITNNSSPGQTSSNFLYQVTRTGNVYAAFAPQLKTLEVLSANGSPIPTVGIHTNPYNTVVSNSIEQLITQGGTQLVNNGWTMLGNSPSQGSSNSFAMSHTNDAVLTWLWLTNHLLTANSGSGGSISGATNGWYARGFSTQLVANPLYGWSFNGWTGTLTSVQNPLDITFDQAHSLGASFIRNFYPVTFSNSIGGILIPNGFTNAEYETQISCTATADNHRALSYIVLDGITNNASPGQTWTNFLYQVVKTGNVYAAYASVTPSTIVSNLALSATDSSISYSFAKGDEEKCLAALIDGDNPILWTPVDGTDYGFNSDFTLAPTNSDTSRIVGILDGTNGVVTGLNPNSWYTMVVYGFNGSNSQSRFLTLGVDQQAIKTQFSRPTTPSSELTFKTTYCTISYYLKQGDGSSRLVAAIEGTNPIVWRPIDGTTYSATDIFNSALTNYDGSRVVAFGAITNGILRGLEHSRPYRLAVFECNGDKYLPDPSVTGSATTANLPPGYHMFSIQ